MINSRYPWVSLLIAVVAMSLLGCASSGSVTPKAIGPNDMSTLAGMWTGDITFPNGTSSPATWELTPTGDYTTRAGAFSAMGKATIGDGNLVLTNTSTTGGTTTAARSGLGSLSQHSDGTLILRGDGHSDRGPFNFVMRRK